MRIRATSDPQRGVTLVELLVAVAVLAIAILIALLLYDAGRKSFKKGENVTEQQQAVRIAFDSARWRTSRGRPRCGPTSGCGG